MGCIRKWVKKKKKKRRTKARRKVEDKLKKEKKKEKEQNKTIKQTMEACVDGACTFFLPIKQNNKKLEKKKKNQISHQQVCALPCILVPTSFHSQHQSVLPRSYCYLHFWTYTHSY